MARGKADGAQWIQSLGEEIGAQLGRAIAQSLQRTLESTVDVRALAERLASGRRNGRAPKATCSEAGCGNPVLAKALCRSHYYRQRYRAQKEGLLTPARRARKKLPSRKRPAEDGAATG